MIAVRSWGIITAKTGPKKRFITRQAACFIHTHLKSGLSIFYFPGWRRFNEKNLSFVMKIILGFYTTIFQLHSHYSATTCRCFSTFQGHLKKDFIYDICQWKDTEAAGKCSVKIRVSSPTKAICKCSLEHDKPKYGLWKCSIKPNQRSGINFKAPLGKWCCQSSSEDTIRYWKKNSSFGTRKKCYIQGHTCQTDLITHL